MPSAGGASATRYSRRIDAELAIQALQMALNTRSIEQGLVHHSDRGVQYASKEYVSVLKQLNIQSGMSRSGNPYDTQKRSVHPYFEI